MRALLLDLGILQNLDKLSDIPLPALTAREKEDLVLRYKTRFSIKPDRKAYKTTLIDLYKTLLREVGLEAVYHTGSGALKTIAKTYFPRVIEEAYFHIFRRKLKISDELRHALSQVCAGFCLKTDEDLLNIHNAPVKDQALKAHNVYLDYFAKLCATSPFSVQNHAFKKIHVPKESDRNQFWLHTFARYDIVDEVSVEKSRIFKKGAGRIMVLSLLNGGPDREVRVEAELKNPWEVIFDIVCGRLDHAEEEIPEQERRIYEWRHALKLWTEMVKGYVPTSMKLASHLVDIAAGSKIDLPKHLMNAWRDHLRSSATSCEAYAIQIISHLIDSPHVDDALLTHVISQIKPFWESSPSRIFLESHDRKVLKSALGFIALAGWLRGDDSWQADDRYWVQVKFNDKLYSYATLPLDFDRIVSFSIRHPEFIEKHWNLLPSPEPYAPRPGITPDNHLADRLLGHKRKALRTLGVLLHLQYLRRVHPRKPPSPRFYEALPRLNLTPNQLKIVSTYHPEAAFDEQLNDLSLIKGLLSTGDRQYHPVLVRLLKQVHSLLPDEALSLFQLGKDSDIENLILRKAAREVDKWPLSETLNHKPFLLFIAKILGVLVINGDKEQAAACFTRLILPSSLKSALKIKIFQQLAGEGVPFKPSDAMAFQEFVNTKNECFLYLQAVDQHFTRDAQKIILTHMMTEFRYSHRSVVSDFLVSFCTRLPEDQRFDFWLRGNETGMWTAVDKAESQYRGLLAQIFKRCYRILISNESPEAANSVKILAEEVKASDKDEEAADIQSAYIQSHYEELPLDDLPLWHTCYLSDKRRRRLNLLNIKKHIDQGEVSQAVQLAQKLNKIPESFAAALEKKILGRPEAYGRISRTKKFLKLYGKMCRDPRPLYCRLLFRLSPGADPHLARDLLSAVVDDSENQLPEDLLPRMLEIITACEPSDFDDAVLTRLKTHLPRLVPHCNLQAFAALRRYEWLPIAAEIDLGAILNACRKHVKSSPILVGGVMESLLEFDCGSAGASVAFQLAQHYVRSHQNRSLYWFSVSETCPLHIASSRTAYLLELMLNANELPSVEHIRILKKLLPYIRELPDLIDTLVSEFVEREEDKRQPEALTLFHGLYKINPGFSHLDPHFIELVQSLSSSKYSMSREECTAVADILEILAIHQRSLFSPMQSQQPATNSSETVGAESGDFLRIKSRDIAFLTRAICAGTNRQTVLLTDRLLDMPPWLLSARSLSVLLEGILRVSCAEETLSSLLDRAWPMYEFHFNSGLHCDLILPLLKLCLKLNSSKALGIACIKIDTCYALLSAARHETTTPFSKCEVIDIHQSLFMKFRQMLTEDRIERKEAKKNLIYLARSMIPSLFPNKTLVGMIELLQKMLFDKSLGIQLKIWQTIVMRVEVKRSDQLPELIKVQFSESIKSALDQSKLRVKLVELAKFSCVVHFFTDNHLLQRFFCSVLSSGNCKMIKKLPALFSSYYRKSSPQVRNDLMTATSFILAQLHDKYAKRDKIVVKYVHDVIDGKISGEIATLHHLTTDQIPEALRGKHNFFGTYEKYLKSLYHHEGPYQPYASLVTERVIDAFLELRMRARETQDPAYQRILIFLSDKMHEKLLSEGVDLKADYAVLVKLIIQAACLRDIHLLEAVDMRRFIDVFEEDTSSPHSEGLAHMIHYVKSIFQDDIFEILPQSSNAETDVVYHFAKIGTQAGFASALFVFALLRDELKKKSSVDYRSHCKTTQVLLASEHDLPPESAQAYCDEIIKAHSFFKSKVSYAKLLKSYSDIILVCEKKSPFMNALYGALLAEVRPDWMDVNTYLNHLLHFASLETTEGNEDHYCRIFEILSFYLRDLRSLSRYVIDSITLILGYFVNSASSCPAPQFKLMRPIIDLLYTRDNIPEFEEDIAPYSAIVYSWSRFREKASDFDVLKAKEQAIMMCASNDRAVWQTLLILFLAEYQHHTQLARPEAYDKILHQVQKQLKATYNREDISKASSWHITYPDKLIKYYQNESHSFPLPPFSEIIDTLCDLISITAYPWTLSVISIFWEPYQYSISERDYPEFFSRFERLISVLVNHALFTKTIIKYEGRDVIPLSATLHYLLAETWLEKQEEPYFEALFQSLDNITAIILKSLEPEMQSKCLKDLKDRLLEAIPLRYRSDGFKNLIKILTTGWNPEELNKAFNTRIQFVKTENLDEVVHSISNYL